MGQIVQVPEHSVGYFFLRSKDVHIEDGTAFITFFARLTREVSFRKEGGKQTEVQTVWVDIDEVALDQASEKARALPNCMQRYELTQNIFHSLYQVSESCPNELFYITPYHQESTREKFIP